MFTHRIHERYLCLARVFNFASDLARVKRCVLPALAGGACAHLTRKSGPVLLRHSGGDAAALGLACPGKKSVCVPELRKGLVCKVCQDKPRIHVVLKLVTVY